MKRRLKLTRYLTGKLKYSRNLLTSILTVFTSRLTINEIRSISGSGNP